MPRFVGFALATLVLFATLESAQALPGFQKLYIKKYASDEKQAEYKELLEKKAKCFTCHQGKKKKNRNDYGVQLARILDKKEHKKYKDEKVAKQIMQAFDVVGKMKSNPKDEKSPTYAELIAKGKLPNGKLEDSQKEPTEEEIKAREAEEKKPIKDDKKGSDKKEE
ncbi:MAG: hypothetical protein RH917_11760 [Lacipirellulaceae bacterium]